MHWGKVYDLPVVSLRLFNVYGPRSRTSGTYGAVFGVFLAQNDDSANVEVYTSVGAEDISQTGVTCLHERAEERGVSKEPRAKKVRDGKYHVTIGYAGQESSADAVKLPWQGQSKSPSAKHSG